jgi:hypothetical protein
MSLTAAENVRPIPTAMGAGTFKNKTRTGTVTVPAPTPVSAINKAITNPMRYGIKFLPWFTGFVATNFRQTVIFRKRALTYLLKEPPREPSA